MFKFSGGSQQTSLEIFNLILPFPDLKYSLGNVTR